MEGAAFGGITSALDLCWVKPETSHEFLKRKNVIKHFSMSESKKVTREEASTACRERFEELNKDKKLPQKIGDVTVLQWGKLASDRESFHSTQ